MSIEVNGIKETLFTFLTETFESGKNPQGTVYLDRKSGLFESIAALSAEAASRHVIPNGTTIVAQVYHSLYYLEVLERFMQGNKERANWAESWQVRSLDEAGWQDLQKKLRASYERVCKTLQAQDDWEDKLDTGFAIAIHSAYHLGAIRQMLKFL